MNAHCEKHEWSASHTSGPCPDCAELAKMYDAFCGAQQAYLKANNETQELQYRYDQLSEKMSNAGDRIEELETERDGLKEMIRDAKARFDDLAHDCAKLLDTVRGHQQHV